MPSFRSRLPIIISVTLLLLISALFVYEFVVASVVKPDDEATVLTASTYVERVTPLLASGDPVRGEQLVTHTYECHVCHVAQAGQIAPGYEGLGERAATQHPPLTAAAYLYEAIVYPTAYVVEGYSAAMPANYANRLSDQDLGDVLAYLLKQ